MKFIKKKKVLKDCWIDDEELGRVPLEISLLMKLDHQNIVMVHVFQCFFVLPKAYIFLRRRKSDYATSGNKIRFFMGKESSFTL